jgi:hypothetical protein
MQWLWIRAQESQEHRCHPCGATIKPSIANKSRVRAKVERASGVIKRAVRLQKVCYRGLAKILQRLNVMAAFANVCLAALRC